MNEDVFFSVINGVPVIGARYPQKQQAIEDAKNMMERMSTHAGDEKASVGISFSLQEDGRYTLQVYSGQEKVVEVENLDEIILHRLRKAYHAKKMFILTCFVDGGGDAPYSLVITEGLGIVIYKPGSCLLV